MFTNDKCMAYLIFAKEVRNRGAQTLCPTVTVLLSPNINEHIVLLWKYQKSVAKTMWNQLYTCNIEKIH